MVLLISRTYDFCYMFCITRYFQASYIRLPYTYICRCKNYIGEVNTKKACIIAAATTTVTSTSSRLDCISYRVIRVP